jgi:hypothetical protein
MATKRLVDVLLWLAPGMIGALLLMAAVAHMEPPSPAPAAGPVEAPPLEVTKDTVLDPAKTYGRIVIKSSDVTIDGRGAWVAGTTQGDPKSYKGVGISAEGVSHVTLRNVQRQGLGGRAEGRGRQAVDRRELRLLR